MQNTLPQVGILNEADFYHYDGNNLSEHNKVTLNYSGNEISSFELESYSIKQPRFYD